MIITAGINAEDFNNLNNFALLQTIGLFLRTLKYISLKIHSNKFVLFEFKSKKATLINLFIIMKFKHDAIYRPRQFSLLNGLIET